MAFTVNPFTKKLDVIGKIPQVSTDPSSPVSEDVWVKTTATIVGGGGGGKINAFVGLGFPIISVGSGSTVYSYQLSYRTKQNTTKRINLDESGSVILGYVEKTSNYSVTSSDYTVNVTANSPTLTLPTASGISGKCYNLKNTGDGTVTIATTSSQTIDGDSTLTLEQYDGVTVQSTGSNWIIL